MWDRFCVYGFAVFVFCVCGEVVVELIVKRFVVG